MSSKFVAEVDEAELAVRILESFLELQRPPGLTTREALAQAQGFNAEMMAHCERAARTAMLYFQECVASGRVVS